MEIQTTLLNLYAINPIGKVFLVIVAGLVLYQGYLTISALVKKKK